MSDEQEQAPDVAVEVEGGDDAPQTEVVVEGDAEVTVEGDGAQSDGDASTE